MIFIKNYALKHALRGLSNFLEGQSLSKLSMKNEGDTTTVNK